MSIGDVKGSRRRFKTRRAEGHAPKPVGLSVSAMIERNRIKAANAQKAAKKK